MAALLLVKRGITSIYSARSVADGVCIITNFRYFASQGNDGRDKSKEEAMGTTTDGKAPNITMSRVTDTAKDELERVTDAATEESGDVGKPKSAEKEKGDEEDVAVSGKGTVTGENQSAG